MKIWCCNFFDVKNSRLNMQITEGEEIFAIHVFIQRVMHFIQNI